MQHDEEQDFLKDLLMVMDAHEMELTIEVADYEVDLGAYILSKIESRPRCAVLTLVPKPPILPE